MAAAILCVAALSAHAAVPGFRDGVAAGEITSASAVLWTRAPRSGTVAVRVSPSRSLTPFVSYSAPARAANDLTVSRKVFVAPGRRYWYRFEQGSARSAVGAFTAAPLPKTHRNVRFAVSGDADATPGPNGAPGFNRFQVYGRMAAEGNDFNVNLGDTIYSDSELAGAPRARTVTEKRAKYELGLALPALRRLRASAGLYSHWDDHEFVNDFSRAESGAAIYDAGVKAFREYAPVAYYPANGLYRSFRWGKNLELFFLDERSFRSAKATAVCGGDLAPTAPQAVRDAFSAFAPSLRTPVATACLAALNDPSRRRRRRGRSS
jgi:alkaline phosphatase D